ncbi:hypothetical protein THAOC_14461, partial [Thalassiosira oceanica]
MSKRSATPPKSPPKGGGDGKPPALTPFNMKSGGGVRRRVAARRPSSPDSSSSESEGEVTAKDDTASYDDEGSLDLSIGGIGIDTDLSEFTAVRSARSRNDSFSIMSIESLQSTGVSDADETEAEKKEEGRERGSARSSMSISTGASDGKPKASEEALEEGDLLQAAMKEADKKRSEEEDAKMWEDIDAVPKSADQHGRPRRSCRSRSRSLSLSYADSEDESDIGKKKQQKQGKKKKDDDEEYKGSDEDESSRTTGTGARGRSRKKKGSRGEESLHVPGEKSSKKKATSSKLYYMCRNKKEIQEGMNDVYQIARTYGPNARLLEDGGEGFASRKVKLNGGIFYPGESKPISMEDLVEKGLKKQTGWTYQNLQEDMAKQLGSNVATLERAKKKTQSLWVNNQLKTQNQEGPNQRQSEVMLASRVETEHSENQSWEEFS